jgi:hypothetical protein
MAALIATSFTADSFRPLEVPSSASLNPPRKPGITMTQQQFPTIGLMTLVAIVGSLTGCIIPLPSCGQSHSLSVPDAVPLGSISRAHWHTMQTNGEANDFVIHRNEFVDNTSELSPYGRDHIAEIAARMSSSPFPVLVQRSYNNADPELDAIRRQLVVRVLTDLGNPDADTRTVVSQPYTNGLNSTEGAQDHGRFVRSRSFSNNVAGGNGI